MAIQITFHRISEKKPKYHDVIIWLKNTTSYGIIESFEPREITVDYCWFEIDECGEYTGVRYCYSEDDGDTLEGHVLHTLFDGYIAEDNWLWCSVDDYWKALDTEIEVK
jgi:hypothetical protein